MLGIFPKQCRMLNVPEILDARKPPTSHLGQLSFLPVTVLKQGAFFTVGQAS